MCKGAFPPLLLHGLVDGLCFIFHSVYISESLIVFLSLSMGVSFRPSLFLFPSLLVRLLPKLVAGLGNQAPHRVAGGGGQGGQTQQLCVLGQRLWMRTLGLEGFCHAGRILLQDHGPAL